MKKKPIKFTLRVFYEHDDTDHVYDYTRIRVVVRGLEGQGGCYRELREFGDYYHDKGYEKAEAYIEGYADALGRDFSTEKEQVNEEE